MENNLTNKEMVMALERLPEGCVIVNPAPNEFVAYEPHTVLRRDELLNTLKHFPEDDIIINSDCGVIIPTPSDKISCVGSEEQHECQCKCNCHDKSLDDIIMKEREMAADFKDRVMSRVEEIVDDFIAYNHNTNVNNLVTMIEYVDKK